MPASTLHHYWLHFELSSSLSAVFRSRPCNSAQSHHSTTHLEAKNLIVLLCSRLETDPHTSASVPLNTSQVLFRPSSYKLLSTLPSL